MLLPGFAGARLLFSGQPPPPPPPPQRQLPRTQQATDSANATGEPPRAATRAASARTRAPSEFAAYIAKLNKEEKVFFANLDDDAKRAIISKEKALASSQPATALTPLRFKILESAADPTIKHTLLTKLKQFQGMYPGMGEYHKLCNWLNAATRVPFGKYHPLPVRADGPSPSPISEIARYLGGVRDTLDRTVFGHTEAKDQILRLLAQWISNPSARGTAIGIQGPKGVGKTSLIKNGLCEALGLPFGFVALGGASDGSFLEGHGFTYEGSTHGKIAEVLIAAGVMNPVLFFDELDKVSQTHRGEEIIGILTHLTDASQNDRFTDRYFTELPLDISKSIIVFAYNDVSLINPILRDRMVTIHVTGYSVAEKVRIAQDYLLPEILVQYNLLPADINISTQMLEHLIQRIEKEEGVRNLRRALDAIIGWINMYQYLPGDALAPTATPTPTPTPTPTLAFPLTITEKHVAEYLSKSSAHLGPGAISAELARTMYT